MKVQTDGKDEYYTLFSLCFSHLLQQTTWADPRKANFNPSQTTQLTQQHTPTQSSQHSPNVSMQNLQQPLPAGWEQAQTPEGEVYYINHVERTTTWFDPRLRKSIKLGLLVRLWQLTKHKITCYMFDLERENA